MSSLHRNEYCRLYTTYYKEHQNKINVVGIGEIGRTRFGKEPKKVNGYRLAYKLGYRNEEYIFRHVIKYFAKCYLYIKVWYKCNDWILLGTYVR